MEVIDELSFRTQLMSNLDAYPLDVDYVVGPGRSGAVAAVYASHHLGVPFVPYKCKPEGRFLVVDTATKSGRTVRKASKFYDGADWVVAYDQQEIGHRLKFWYEELSIGRGKENEYNGTRCSTGLEGVAV